jgi:hypothetical protein
MSRTRSLAVLVLAVVLSPALAGSSVRESAPVAVPAANRPVRFTGAVGERFRVDLIVPREVPPNRPFPLTVRVEAVGRWWHRPNRPDLSDLPRFARRFEITLPVPEAPAARRKRESAVAPGPDREDADRGVWEFDYLLKLKSGAVPRVPPLPLAYYTPDLHPDLPGRFPTAFGREVPLVIRTPGTAESARGAPIETPERFWHVVEGPEVLASAGPALPSLSWLIASFLAPPVAAVAGCLAWRRLSPNAARVARKRQNRAAAEALRALDLLGPSTEAETVGRVVGIVAGYLSDRVGLPARPPVPADVASHVRRAGGNADLADKTAEFFRACDAVRYGPVVPGGRDDLTAAARQLIETLEAESWLPGS